MNYFPSKVALYLSFLSLPLLTQCGGSDSANTLYNDNTPDDSATITEADLQALQSGDSFFFEQGDQALVIQMTGLNQANLKFSKGAQVVTGESSDLTWTAQTADSFTYALTVTSTLSNFATFSATFKVLPKTAKKDTNGKIIIQTNIQTISQDTLPIKGETWTDPILLLSQKP